MYDGVLFHQVPGKGGDLGIMTLNRPSVLNSLDHDMIHAMHAQLKKWATAEDIKAVIIQAAEGRAFCAGGDLRLTFDRIKNHDLIMTEFFRDEYQLNRSIFHFPKPYIALLDGITMGGGVGVSIHGSHRVATERLLFAMPETGIGFFPDVGGTYFLPRLPSHMGFYLGLSGARLASDDCVALGLAQVKVARESLPKIIDALAQQTFSNNPRNDVSNVLAQFKQEIPAAKILAHEADINHCFAKDNMEAITAALQQCESAFCHEAAENLTKKSPTSLKVTLRALQEGYRMDFDACMRQEYRLVTRFLQSHDFAEGIRAVIIDKDQKPNWQPKTLANVQDHEINSYFAPLEKELA